MKRLSWKSLLAAASIATVAFLYVLVPTKAHARLIDSGDAQYTYYFASQADLNSGNFSLAVGTEFYGCGGAHIIRGEINTVYARSFNWSCANPTATFSCNILTLTGYGLDLKPCGDLNWDGFQNCQLRGGVCSNCVPYLGGPRVPGVPYCD